MDGGTALITVYRSSGMNASTDATAVRNLLIRNGIEAELADDNQPGVSSGSFEIRVAEADSAQAESLIAAADSDEETIADPSRDLDMVTLRRTMGATGEMEAISIKSILDANGIDCMVVGTSTMPNLSFFVRVARNDIAQAESVLEEAQAAGPAAAAEGASSTEGTTPPGV